MHAVIVLIPITVQNWESAASLEVDEHQRGFIRSNAWSIAESLYHPELKPMGIYRGGTMVGFLMYGSAEQDGRAWLFRIMIDRKYQGQGLGQGSAATGHSSHARRGVHRGQCRLGSRK